MSLAAHESSGTAPSPVDDRRFRPFEELRARGATSVVKATDTHSGATVALKSSPPESGTTYDQEAAMLLATAGDGVPRLLAHGRFVSGRTFLAASWAEGKPLQALPRPLTPEQTADLALRLGEVLERAHRAGVVHGDISPGNIVLPAERATEATLIDFGSACWMESEEHPRAKGTAGYVAPEVQRSERPSTGADIFALGCVLYYAMTGLGPFDAPTAQKMRVRGALDEPEPLPSLVPHVAPELARAIHRMIAKAPGDRPSAEELVRTLRSRRSEPPTDRGHALSRQAPVTTLLLATRKDAGAPPPPDETLPDHIWRADEDAPEATACEGLVRRYGGEAVRLANGGVSGVWSDSGGLRDRARAADRCARAIHRRLGGSYAVSVVTGRRPDAAWDAIVRRATRLLEREQSPAMDAITRRLVRASSLEAPANDSVPDGERRLMGRLTPFVGRARELGYLQEVCARVASESRAGAVEVVAPAGYGKSRLRYELARGLGREWRVWIARADPSATSAPFATLRRALKVFLGTSHLASAAAARERVMQWADANGEDPARIGPFLCELLDLYEDEADSPDVLRAARRDPVLMRDQLVRACVAWARAECAQGPVLMVVEDLHWVDAPSVEVLRLVHQSLSLEPWMLLVLSRPDAEQRSRTPPLERLELPPIGREAAAALVSAVCADVSDSTAHRLAALAGPDVFFLEELLRAHSEESTDPSHRTVESLLAARIADLPRLERAVLGAAVVYGASFWTGGVAALVECPAPSLSRALDRLASRELISPRQASQIGGEREWSFRHATVRSVVHAGLDPDERALAHCRAAEWLVETGQTSPQIIATHWERGRAPQLAVPWWARAAARAFEANDMAGAIDHAARGLRCASGTHRGELLALTAHARRWTGDDRGVLSAAHEALELLTVSDPEYFPSLGELAAAAGRLGEVELLRETAERLQAVADRSEAAVIASSRAAVALLLAGEPEMAAPLMEAIELRAPAAPDGVMKARIHNALAIRAVTRGDLWAYTRHTEAAVTAYTAAGDLRAASSARVNVAFGYAEHGLYGQARGTLEQVIEAGSALSLDYPLSAARQNLANVLWRLGELEAALAMGEAAASSFAERAARRFEAGSRIYVAAIRLAMGMPAKALVESERALELADASPALGCFALAVKSRAVGELGDEGLRLELAERAYETLEGLEAVEEGEAWVRLAYAEALAASGDAGGALRVCRHGAQRLLRRASRIDDPAMREGFLEHVAENRALLEGAGFAR